MKASERALAVVLVAWLEADGWEVNQEVKFRPDARKASIWIADVVARRAGIVAVYEVKTAMGLPVMEQAERWMEYADQAWIVVPGHGKPANHGHAYGYRRLEQDGIGVLHVRGWTKVEVQIAGRPGGELPPITVRVSTVVEATNTHAFTGPLELALLPEHRDGSFAGAGSQIGTRVSKTNLVLARVREYITDRGGSAPIEDVVRNVGENWITRRAKDGKIPRVRVNGCSAVAMLELVEPGNEAPFMSERTARTAPRDRVAFG